MLQCRKNRLPDWPNRAILADRRVFSASALRTRVPKEFACSLSTCRSSTFTCPPPPLFSANGKAALRSSHRFSYSGNGPTAAGEGEARAAPITGNASGPSRPAPFTRVQLASLASALLRPSVFRRSALDLVQFSYFMLTPPGKKWLPELVPLRGRWREGGQDLGILANP
ncbi:hypothetical protein HJG60_008280 [Phyllostomus discolor]|uniref:Uncharacterized protein n=1 Tax=Phyllostomus discolor TaxID=89673 RepID=A0A833Z6U0_9CHIR|nr:hypothetical protein HJG60_008280 [Phyllostomus discolor]